MAAYILSNALFYIKDILPITSGIGATFRISKDLERDLNIETGGVNAFVLLKNSAQIERMLVTCTGGVATIVKRWLEQDGITENANLKKVWWDGSIGYISVKPDDFIATGKLDTSWTTTWWLRSGFGSNKHVRINRTTGIEEAKNVTDGTTILSSDKIRLEKASGDYEDFSMSLLQNSIAGMTSEYIFCGSASINDSCYISNLSKFKSGWLSSIWQTVAITDFLVYASWNSEQSYTFYFIKTWTPQDITFRIETDNWSWTRSGTLVNANATLVVAIASIPANWVYKLTLPANFINASSGTPIHFVFWQGSQYVNASNYISVGINEESVATYENISSPWSNVSTSLTISVYTTPTGAYSLPTTLSCLANCVLYSITTPSPWQDYSWTSSITIDWWVYSNRSIAFSQSARVFTFLEPVVLTAWVSYTITINGSGNYTTISWYSWYSASAQINQTSFIYLQNITSYSATVANNQWIINTYISKANATTAIKASVYALLPQGASAGTYPSIVKDRYLWWFSSLTKWATYYLSNTGVISSTAGTVSKVLGVAVSPTTIRIDSAINAS